VIDCLSQSRVMVVRRMVARKVLYCTADTAPSHGRVLFSLGHPGRSGLSHADMDQDMMIVRRWRFVVLKCRVDGILTTTGIFVPKFAKLDQELIGAHRS
jgi:hypothetical protein